MTEVISASRALAYAKKGIKVRLNSWMEKKYLVINDYGQIEDETGYQNSDVTLHLIFKPGTEWSIHPDSQKTYLEIRELDEKLFWTGPRHPDTRCSCGGIYTELNLHSDYCKLSELSTGIYMYGEGKD